VLDISGSEGRDPIEDFEQINSELKVFSEELSTRPMIVAANKCDLIDEEKIEEYRAYFEEKGYAFFPLMAAIAEGTKELINYTASELAKLPPLKIYDVEPEPVEDFTEPKERKFTLRKEEDVYIIEAEWLLKILETVDPDDYESLQYFQRVLQSTGIIDALIKAGVQDGDTVSVYDIEFDYVS
jgi:GTP-binding protein